MRIAALIEISPTADGLLPLELIARAYQASGGAPVVLVVADELRESVERAIDPLVPLMPLDIPGVRYVSGTDDAAIARYARIADEVLLTSASLQACIPREPVRAEEAPSLWSGPPAARHSTPRSAVA